MKREEAIVRRRASALQRDGKLRNADAYVAGTLQQIRSRTVPKGHTPPGDYRGRVDNRDGTVTYT